jgi:membrane protein DedA with SNARE-associated domain
VQQQLEHFVSQYGYIAVFLLMLAESACIPIPSEVIMMFGGALAAGAVPGAHPALIGIFAAGVLGNVAGSYLSWAVGKYAGQAVIRRWGRRVGIREHEIDRSIAWFERHGPVAVLFGRVIPVIRTFISLPAGFADMSAGQFGLYTTLGCIPWTAALAIAGYALGANWQSVASDFHGPTYAIAGILVVGLVVGFVLYRRRRRAAEASGSGGPAGDGGPLGNAGYPMNNAGYPMSTAGSPVNNAGSPVNNAGYPVNVDNSVASGDGPPVAPGYPVGPTPYGPPIPAMYPDQGRGAYPEEASNPNGRWGPGGSAQPTGAQPVGGQPVGGQPVGGWPDDTRLDGARPVDSPWDQTNQQHR